MYDSKLRASQFPNMETQVSKHLIDYKLAETTLPCSLHLPPPHAPFSLTACLVPSVWTHPVMLNPVYSEIALSSRAGPCEFSRCCPS